MSDSGQGAGAKIRLVVLLGILAVVAIGLYRDRVVIKNKIDTTLAKIDELAASEEANLSGVSKETIRETLNMEPIETFDDEEYGFHVEKYSFGRGLPFIPGNNLTVVYDNNSYIKYNLNKEYDGSTIQKTKGVYLPPEEERKPLQIGGGGSAPAPKKKSSGDKKDDQKEDGAEDKKEDDADDKKDDDSSDEGGDKKEDDKKEDDGA